MKFFVPECAVVHLSKHCFTSTGAWNLAFASLMSVHLLLSHAGAMSCSTDAQLTAGYTQIADVSLQRVEDTDKDTEKVEVQILCGRAL